MKIAKLSLKQIKNILKKEKEFEDIDKWKFEKIATGEMEHKYKVSKGNKVYFVKEIKDNLHKHEIQAEYFLTKIKLNSLPYSRYPKLLRKKLLVRDFIEGKMLVSKNLSAELLKDFIKFQDIMNKKSFFYKHNVYGMTKFGQIDCGYYKKGLKKNFAYASRSLRRLEKYNLGILSKFYEILGHIKKDKASIIQDYVNMPFARQHNDFREDNIIETKDGKQYLIDWGSAFGHHPFMRDLAPFLVNNPKSMNILIKNSEIAKKASKEQIDRWLYIALVARFLSILRWMINPKDERCNTKSKCKKFLEYEYKTYKCLLKNN